MVTVNGTDIELPDGACAADVLGVLGLPGQGIAIAVDGQVHPRRSWPQQLSDGAVIEVLTAVQGG